VLIVGVNGTGKTTTVGKLARVIKDAGLTPLICAADTFAPPPSSSCRCGATRAGVDFIRAQGGADPAAVVFDAIAAGKARKRGRHPGRHGRPSPHARQPDGGARKDRADRRAGSGRARRTKCCSCSTTTVGQNGLAQAREFMSVAASPGSSSRS
jgi:fused signal recognition particle receptor